MKRYLNLFIPVLFMAGMFYSAHAQEFNYKVNAIYIYYFTKYIEWPEHMGETLTIGVLGDSPVYDQLKIITANKKSGTFSIIIKRIQLAEIKSCQLIVVSKSQTSLLKKIQEASEHLPILIVTEKRGVLKKGGDISIYIDEEDNFKTKIELNQADIHARNLKIANELVVMANQ